MIRIPLFKVFMSPDVDKPLLETIHSGFIGQGQKVEEFESMLSEYVNNPYCLSLSSGTHGLHLALILAGVQPGDSVLTPAATCFATTAAILMQKAKPVWIDTKRDDLNVDPEDIKRKINKHISAIVIMHWGGGLCDMNEIYNIAKEYDIPIIEDGAHAIGAEYYGNKIGNCSHSKYCMLSLQAIKLISAVDGGLLFINKEFPEDYKRGKLLRWFGISREGLKRDLRCEEAIFESGFKYHMTDVNAVIGMANFKYIDELLDKTNENVQYYIKELKNISGIQVLQHTDQKKKSSNWLFTVKVRDRTGFARMMGEKGIHISKVHERNDIHPCVKDFKCSLPNLDYLNSRFVCIPCGWWVDKEAREYIVDAIKGGW